jgi:hypothetical protein
MIYEVFYVCCCGYEWEKISLDPEKISHCPDCNQPNEPDDVKEMPSPKEE